MVDRSLWERDYAGSNPVTQTEIVWGIRRGGEMPCKQLAEGSTPSFSTAMNPKRVITHHPMFQFLFVQTSRRNIVIAANGPARWVAGSPGLSFGKDAGLQSR